jgi:hypothetical protein
METLKILGSLALLSTSLTFLASPGNALEDFQGKVVLPVGARWGNVYLKAGEYRISYAPISDVPLLRVRGKDGPTKFVVAMLREERAGLESGTLTLVKMDGKYFVRTLEAAYVGQVLTFRVPTHQTPELARREKPALQLCVTSPGK